MPKDYHHMTQEIRSQIYALKSTGMALSKIGHIVGYDASAICREIKRNTGGRGYPLAMAKERRAKASRTPKKLTPKLISIIEDRIQKDWSPDQIAGRLKEEGIVNISHEAIYQHIWKDKRTGGTLYKHLRHHSKKYNKRSSDKAGRGCIPNRVDIDERPLIVANCYFAKPYHSWERGLNEHTNGLVRQYLPKSTDFTQVSDQTVQVIAEKLNHRPRKSLYYKTPMEVILMHRSQTRIARVSQDG